MAALGQLAAGMAHELRNPLTAMKMLIQNAVKGGAAKGLTDRDLHVLDAETTRLERSLQTFLDFARPPALEKRPGDVCKVIGEILQLIRARADRQGVQINCEAAVGPLVIEADHEQLRQLFLNLLLNALDALPQGGSVCISAAESAPPAAQGDVGSTSWITIAVADNGPGIPQNLGEQIFSPYVSTKDAGLGLGLAICRQIVQLHGGQITVSNGTEGGAVFTVELPKSNSSVANSL
jgi:signal transduction histidine kinase